MQILRKIEISKMATSSSFSTKTKFSDTSWTPSKLSQEGYLSLAKITNGFSAPITEEHAWAVVFECLKCLKSVMESKPSRVFIVTSTRHILLHREGRVHESTFLSDQNEDHDGSTTEAGKNYVFVNFDGKKNFELILMMPYRNF